MENASIYFSFIELECAISKGNPHKDNFHNLIFGIDKISTFKENEIQNERTREKCLRSLRNCLP